MRTNSCRCYVHYACFFFLLKALICLNDSLEISSFWNRISSSIWMKECKNTIFKPVIDFVTSRKGNWRKKVILLENFLFFQDFGSKALFYWIFVLQFLKCVKRRYSVLPLPVIPVAKLVTFPLIKFLKTTFENLVLKTLFILLQDSTTSVEGDAGSTWSSGRQMSIREWDIPYEELKIGDKIGIGRFSTVHAGNWHGDVAIKFLNMENLDDENTLEAFRLDVATFR